MENGFTAEATKTCMAVYDVDLLTNDNVAEYREEGKDRGECCFSVDNEKWDVIYLQSIGEVADTGSAFVRMGDDDHFVSTIDEFLKVVVLRSGFMELGE
jgi:hypothetical protein